ncbi:MAG: hypothetical protein QM723_14015 [Myxococcaceae bacterium]
MQRLTWGLLLVSSLATAQGLPRLAVSGLTAQGGVDQKTAELLGDLLTADLAAAGKWKVTSSHELQVLLGVERQKELMGCSDQQCQVEMAQALGADLMVSGNVGAVGNLRVITVVLFDSKKGAVQRRETLEVNDEGALADGIHTIASRFTGIESGPRASGGVRKGWFVLGGGAVVAIAGAIFGVVALGQYDQYKLTPTNTGLHSNAQTFGYLADGCYGVAIIAGLIGAAMLLFGGDR